MSMKSKIFGVLLLFLVISFFWTQSALGASAAEDQTSNAISGSARRTPPDLRGTWSGTFFSKHPDARPFTITVVISPDPKGVLFGTSGLESDCIKNPRLQVSVTGSKVVLAGSDTDGDSIMFRGNLDSTGTLLTMNYITNGSASGRCETDSGTGTLGKR
jgi:hypothetical protein